MKNLNVVFVLFVSLLMFQSCVKEEQDQNQDAAPELPAVESFLIPFTDFEDADTTGYAPPGGEEAGLRAPTFQNWFHGASNVVIWNTIISLNLAIPTAAFLESFNHDAISQGNGLWLWEYSFTGAAGNSYEAKLYGEVLAIGEVKWDMYISQVNGFQDVHWYTGITNNTNANWTLNHQPNNPEAFLQIDHQKDNGNGHASIRYTNIIPNNAGNGDYIEHRQDNSSSAEFNRAYDIYKASTDKLIEIQWNRPGKDGRVKDENHFGDMEWHCWDENLQDTAC